MNHTAPLTRTALNHAVHDDGGQQHDRQVLAFFQPVLQDSVVAIVSQAATLCHA